MTVPAAEFSAGAIAAGETLEWITAALAGAGISISVKELLKPRQSEIEKDIGKDIDWDNYDWGDMLDSPAAQDQIDELDKTINKLYGNASAKWKEMYEKSLSPTPTPETSPDKPEPSPPVTVAPIDPDTVTPPGWDTLRKASMKNGYLLLGAGTYWCLKEAAKGLWDKLMNTEEEYQISNEKNPFLYKDLIGYMHYSYYSSGNLVERYNYMYDSRGTTSFQILEDKSYKFNGSPGYNVSFFSLKNDESLPMSIFNREIYRGNVNTWSNKDYYSSCAGAGQNTCSYEYVSYIPYTLNGQSFDATVKPYGKTTVWPSTDLKNDYDNNKSPSIPATAPAPAIKIPSLDDVKDLQKKGNAADDDDRPSVILDWLKGLYTNPSTDPKPDPNPTTAPDPGPNPDPDPNPDPTTTPAVNPNISGAPKPSGTPENPDGTDTDVDVDKYKTDLRLVFPFCIPFDLIHLIKAFEAEPEAPVFEFPIDIELNDPFNTSARSAKKVVDYHHTFELDMSDYEPVINIFRIFEVIFFIIGLLLITRQQMIKG